MPNAYRHSFPAELVTHVSSLCGRRGKEWLERLPEAIAHLETKWGVNVGVPFEKGEFNFVAPATGNDLDAVIKIAPPYTTTEIFAEAEFLRVRDGHGCVRILAEDRSGQAILLERARPGDTMDVHFSSDPFACVQPAIEVLKSILRPSGHGTDVQRLDEWFDNFRRFRETDFPQDYGERAFEIYARLRRQKDRIYYLHGDFHPGNIVTSDHRGPFLAIDPKGLIGHIAYDIAVFLNNLHWWQKGKPRVTELLDFGLRKFAGAFGIEELDLREAAFANMVIGAWWNFDEMPDQYDNEVRLADVWDLSVV